MNMAVDSIDYNSPEMQKQYELNRQFYKYAQRMPEDFDAQERLDSLYDQYREVFYAGKGEITRYVNDWFPKFMSLETLSQEDIFKFVHEKAIPPKTGRESRERHITRRFSKHFWCPNLGYVTVWSIPSINNYITCEEWPYGLPTSMLEWMGVIVPQTAYGAHYTRSVMSIITGRGFPEFDDRWTYDLDVWLNNTTTPSDHLDGGRRRVWNIRKAFTGKE